MKKWSFIRIYLQKNWYKNKQEKSLSYLFFQDMYIKLKCSGTKLKLFNFVVIPFEKEIYSMKTIKCLKLKNNVISNFIFILYCVKSKEYRIVRAKEKKIMALKNVCTLVRSSIIQIRNCFLFKSLSKSLNDIVGQLD